MFYLGNDIKFSNFEYKYAYLNFLRTAFEYDSISNERSCDFEYIYDVAQINNLSSNFKIETLKKETDIETFISVTKWVNSVLNNDLIPQYPDKSVSDIILDAKNNKSGVSCFGYAAVLNEIFCCMGYKSRYIFCMPIDYHFIDCHVVTIVYHSESKKWLLFDAAQNLYYTDNQGEILSIQQLRESLIEDKEINICLLDQGIVKSMDVKIINIMKQRLLIYMSKNLYRFSCFRNPQIDRFARKKEVYCYHLVPKGYMTLPYKETKYFKERDVKQIECYTSNDKEFWRLPENV